MNTDTNVKIVELLLKKLMIYIPNVILFRVSNAYLFLLCTVFINPCANSQNISHEYFKLIKQGDSLYYSGQYSKSLEHYYKAEEYSPFPTTYLYMSGCYYMNNDKEKACSYLKKAIEAGLYYTIEYTNDLIKTEGCIDDEDKEKWNYFRGKRVAKGELPELITKFLWRKELDQKFRNSEKKTTEEWNEQKKIDSVNGVFLDSIINDLNRWPGIDELGYNNSSIPFLIAIHSDQNIEFQKKCLQYAYEALRKNNIPLSLFANLYDRIELNEGKKQLFGTQLKYENNQYVIPELKYPELAEIYRQYFELPSLKQYLDDIHKERK